jgi:type II secretory pathway component PulM
MEAPDQPKELPAPEIDQNEKPVKPESQPKPRKRNILRWALVFLIVFGLGVLVTLFTLYIPQREALQAGETKLKEADQKIADLQKRIDSLTSLETKNQTLQTDQKNDALHTNLLMARVDIASAQLALAKNDPAKARVALTKTPKTLDTLASLMEQNQQKIVQDMQSRLKLAASEIGNNNYAANSDLDVLANGLVQLENSFFSTP